MGSLMPRATARASESFWATPVGPCLRTGCYKQLPPRVQVSPWYIHKPQSRNIGAPFKAQVYTILVHGPSGDLKLVAWVSQVPHTNGKPTSSRVKPCIPIPVGSCHTSFLQVLNLNGSGVLSLKIW